MSYAKEANRILEDYRNQSKKELDMRFEEVFRNVPEYQDLLQHRNELGYEYLKKSISGDKEELKNLEDEIKSTEEKMHKMLILSGYPNDYLEEKHRCEKCKDTGVYNGKMCSCKKTIMVNIARDKSSLNEQMKQQNFDRFDINVFDTKKDSSHGMSQRENMEAISENLKYYSKNYTKNAKSLLLYGQVGTGKTYLLSCMAKEIIENGYSVIYLSAMQLLKQLFSIRYQNFNEKPQPEVEDIIYNCDVLMIDDLGTENSTETNISLLFDLLNYRIQNQKTTIISTNIDLDDLTTQYDQRISSRIKGEFIPIQFFGRDIREERFKNGL
ncbi:MAG: ATP-binding protein [Finegoldia magna]|uniref:ATP-binding protein n=1 Tax=Finegoldia magna TaxID=1260 RepID=UPI00290BD2D2|nr:ATP-binding protein [Finegoldia magna]MDU5369715.1 ATP-binding protein [Finegoldia magna]MDU5444305.1 ATP-binding protein [Finegoldia magna]